MEDPMRVLMTGATGFVGQRLARALIERGDEVVLSRDAAAARARLPGILSAHAWQALEEAAPREAFDGVDQVVHLAGETVVGRWTDAKKRAIHESRATGTRNLVSAMRGTSVSALISASAIGYYGDRGETELREDDPPGEDFLARVCVDWEREARAAEAQGTRVVCGRIGVVLGDEGGALDKMLPIYKAGGGGPIGGGRQWWTWIHIDDLVAALLWSIDHETLAGAVNLVAPGVCRQREFAAALGAAVRRPAFIPTPAFAIKLALGGFAVELLASRRVLPGVLEEAGFPFAHPEIAGALRHLVGG
jgi:uncharacterized protein (TIGR01777 family)